MLMKLIDVENLHRGIYTTTLVYNPVVYTNKSQSGWIIRFIGDRTNVDFRLDPENEITQEIIDKLEASLFEGLNLTVAVYEGSLYVFVGHMDTNEVLDVIRKAD